MNQVDSVLYTTTPFSEAWVRVPSRTPSRFGLLGCQRPEGGCDDRVKGSKPGFQGMRRISSQVDITLCTVYVTNWSCLIQWIWPSGQHPPPERPSNDRRDGETANDGTVARGPAPHSSRRHRPPAGRAPDDPRADPASRHGRNLGSREPEGPENAPDLVEIETSHLEKPPPSAASATAADGAFAPLDHFFAGGTPITPERVLALGDPAHASVVPKSAGTGPAS